MNEPCHDMRKEDSMENNNLVLEIINKYFCGSEQLLYRRQKINVES